MDVFISHAHCDEELVAPLIKLLESLFNFNKDKLRCTSSSKYTLELGDNPTQKLKSELEEATLVIGILTATSVRTSWVLSELGAAWGFGKQLVLLVFPGVMNEDIPGPFEGLVKIDFRVKENNRYIIHEFSNSKLILKKLKSMIEIISTIWKLKKKVGVDKSIEKYYENISKYTAQLRLTESLETRISMLDNTHGLRFKEIVEYCENELWIWGISCMHIINGNTRLQLKKWLDKGKHRKLRVLILNPDIVDSKINNNFKLDFGPICSVSHNQVVDDIRLGLNNLQQWKKKNSLTSKQFDLRTTCWNMIFSGVAIDMKTDNEVIQAEYYSYDKQSTVDDRPNIIVRKGSKYWDSYHNSIINLFKSGNPI